MSAALEKSRAANVTVKLELSERERIKSIAAFRNRTPHFIMKEAIQQYLDHAEIEQNFISAGQSSWQDYESTELHITLEEAKKWAKKLPVDQGAALKACHT